MDSERKYLSIKQGKPICYVCHKKISPKDFTILDEKGFLYFLHKKCEDGYYKWLGEMYRG